MTKIIEIIVIAMIGTIAIVSVPILFTIMCLAFLLEIVSGVRK